MLKRIDASTHRRIDASTQRRLPGLRDRWPVQRRHKQERSAVLNGPSLLRLTGAHGCAGFTMRIGESYVLAYKERVAPPGSITDEFQRAVDVVQEH